MSTFSDNEKLIFDLLQQLYSKKVDLAGFISKKAMDKSQAELIEGIILAWYGEDKAISILSSLNSVVWSHIALSNFYYDIKEDNAIKVSMSHIDKLLVLEDADGSLTSKYFGLVKAKYYLRQNASNEALSLVKSVLVNMNNPFIKAMGSYLLSIIYKHNGDINSFINMVDEALEIARTNKLDYLVGLCKFEQSLVQVNSMAFCVERAQEAKNIFNSLGRTLEEKQARMHLQELEGALENAYYKVGNYLFISKQMRNVRKEIDELLHASDPIMILGPTGSGKTRIAEAIHELSNRDGEFLAINCSAIPTNLIESELFGHEKGAFTGATSKKIGYLEKANKGTLFLDELAEMPIELQPKLLKVIEEKKFYPLGSTNVKHIDVRFIAATNRGREEISDGKILRVDLFHRFTWPITLEGLDKRREEIIPLAEEFIKLHCGEGNKGHYTLTDDAKDFLLAKTYEGNIRTLEQNIKRAIAKAASAQSKYIKPYMLEDTYNKAPVVGEKASSANSITVEVLPENGLERAVAQTIIELIEYALKVCKNNKHAAEFLKIDERKLYRAIKEYNIKPPNKSYD